MDEPEEQPTEQPKPIMDLIAGGKFLYIAAPMVRYSKLPFRLLCRRWGCDVAFTPMIVAQDFVSSKFARRAEFSTNPNDRPLITQFAAKDPVVLGRAAEFVAKVCDGIDINCGCPQKWVIAESYGCALLKKPDLVRDMVRTAKQMSGLPVSIKIRVADDMSETIELVKRAEAVGVSWITVHGRTVSQRSSVPVNHDAVKMVKENASVPIFANGHCFTIQDATDWKEKTNVNGIMAARGLLENPALFRGYDLTPPQVVSEYCDLALSYGVPQHITHQHLMFMLHRVHSREERRRFNTLRSVPAILSYLQTAGYNFDSQYNTLDTTPSNL